MSRFKRDMEYWFIENEMPIRSRTHFWFKVLGLLVINPGVSAVYWHRVARTVYLMGPRFLTPSRILDRWTEFVTGAQLPGESDIGVGLRVYHPNGLVVSPKSKLGERVSLHSDVVMHGLEWDSSTGTLYAASSTPNTFYTVNTSTGLATTVGSIGLTSFNNLGYNSDTDVMYLTNSNTDSFYTINRATGAPTLIGALGGPTNPNGLAYNYDNDRN